MIETLCGLPDGLASGGFGVSAEILLVRLRRGRPLDPESRRRRAFFARHPFSLWLLSLRIPSTAGLGAPTARAALENVSVMQQAVQHGGDSGTVA